MPAVATSMNVAQLWQTALISLQKRLPKNTYDHYLSMTDMRSFDDDLATITAPNAFVVGTLQSRFANEVEKAVSEVVGRRVRVEFAMDSGNGQVEEPSRPKPRNRPVAERPQQVNHQSHLTPSAGNLLPNLTFETYVVGSSNRMAHAAANAIAEHPGTQYNPFFVHGGVGLGKTHLLHSIGHRALELNPELKVMYVTSETFTNDVINAIRQQRMDDFRERYRTIDVVHGLVDAKAEDRITLYTGNDDHIVLDLLTPFVAHRAGEPVTVRIKGGLLGHWSVWTRSAVEIFAKCKAAAQNGVAPQELLALDSRVTAMNAALFDVENDFHGCIAGCHEVLRRQGLLEGIWCLDPAEGLGRGQSEALDRVISDFSDLTDDAFVAGNLSRWLEGN